MLPLDIAFFTMTDLISSFLCVSFLLPFAQEIPHCSSMPSAFSGSDRENRWNPALFYGWPTFYPGGFYQQAALLFLSRNAKYRWQGKSGALQGCGPDAAPYCLFP